MMQFLRALRAGVVVADPANLKKRQQMVDALMVLLGVVVALAGRFGFEIRLTPEELVELAGGIFVAYGAVNSVLSAASTDKIGLLPARRDDRLDRDGDEPGSSGGPAF